MHVINVLKYQARRLTGLIPCYIQQLYNIGPRVQILQYFDLPEYLGMPDRFEYLNAYFLPVECVDSFEYLRVLASAHLLNDSIVI